MTAARKVDSKAAVKDTRSVAEKVVLRAVYSAFWRADLLAVLLVACWVGHSVAPRVGQ
jgi:hypothetical protein